MRQNRHQIILRPLVILIILLPGHLCAAREVQTVHKLRVSKRLEACCYYVVHGHYPDYITLYTPEELNEYKLWYETDEDILKVCNLGENEGDIQITRPPGYDTAAVRVPQVKDEENILGVDTTQQGAVAAAEEPSHEIDEKSQVYVKNSTPNHVTLKPNIVPEESYNQENIESCKLVKQVTISVNFHVSVNPHTGSIEIIHVKGDTR
ncbi:uncharacterized protein LOC129792201 isoform X2 [Lutzomyia longipalpis]|uniref:uncharacterized protein LOC129792201 isoform X2 n=1 Tax=Lutzomyia longipalpis TaxID=7200 RepID=UPI0024841F6A|nr:uncharacterized protein LOC129792201 isoform X2 [Lutzomyia longipalpis]